MEAAKCLLREDTDDDRSSSSGDEGGDDDIVMSPCTRAEANKRRRLSVQRKTESPYVECGYILGSVAEVERLWSLAKYVTPHHCQKMHPVNVEAQMFLKINYSYWNVGSVYDALVELNMST
jgi:hypothetical protein